MESTPTFDALWSHLQEVAARITRSFVRGNLTPDDLLHEAQYAIWRQVPNLVRAYENGWTSVTRLGTTMIRNACLDARRRENVLLGNGKQVDDFWDHMPEEVVARENERSMEHLVAEMGEVVGSLERQVLEQLVAAPDSVSYQGKLAARSIARENGWGIPLATQVVEGLRGAAAVTA